MARSDSASKRLSRVIKEIPIPDRPVGITDVRSGKIVHVYKWEEVPTSLIASLLRDLVTLTSEDQFDASLARAFAVANLNPANPVHWRMLLYFFCVGSLWRSERTGCTKTMGFFAPYRAAQGL